MKRLNLEGKDPVNARIFTYHFGDADDEAGKSLMHRIACENNGVYFGIPEKGAPLKLIMASYFTYLAVGIIPKQGTESTESYREYRECIFLY